jgi:hypothetical protein
MDKARLDKLLASKGIEARSGRLTIEIDKDLAEEAHYVDAMLLRNNRKFSASRLLRTQLVAHLARIAESANGKHLNFDVGDVLAVMKSIADGKQTGAKSPRLLQKGPLRGLSRAHVFQASFIVRNLQNANANGRAKQRLIRAVKSKYGKFPCPEHMIDEDDIRLFAKSFVDDALQERSARNELTGEHIYFINFLNRNYFLFLASHDDGEEKLTEYKTSSMTEYPKIAEHLDVYRNDSIKG